MAMTRPVPAPENTFPSLDQYLEQCNTAELKDLCASAELLQPSPEDQMLDVACGEGEATLFFAPLVRQVVASDLTMQMLKKAQEQISESGGIENVTFREADAQDMPFPAGSFTLLTCRIATHHFPKLEQALKEFHRVLRRGGRMVVIDLPQPEDPEIADFYQKLESCRNPTHVRTYNEKDWRRMLAEAEFILGESQEVVIPFDFQEWVKQKNVGKECAKAISHQLASAPRKIQDYFQVELFAGELESFSERRLVITAKRPEKEKK